MALTAYGLAGATTGSLLSSDIFATLGFKDPANIDLPRRQKTALKTAESEVLLA